MYGSVGLVAKKTTNKTIVATSANADIRLINDYVTRNTNILKQLEDSMNKDKAEERLSLLKKEINMKIATISNISQ